MEPRSGKVGLDRARGTTDGHRDISPTYLTTALLSLNSILAADLLSIDASHCQAAVSQ